MKRPRGMPQRDKALLHEMVIVREKMQRVGISVYVERDFYEKTKVPPTTQVTKVWDCNYARRAARVETRYWLFCPIETYLGNSAELDALATRYTALCQHRRDNVLRR